MTDHAMAEWARTVAVSRTVRVGASDIARFAIATGACAEEYFDPAAARARGYADVVAPELFYIALRTGVFNLVPQDDLHEEGTPRGDLPPITFSQAMAGETSAQLHRRFVAGDVVVCTREVVSTDGKQGRSGWLTFITFEYRYADTAGVPFVVERFTRIFR